MISGSNPKRFSSNSQTLQHIAPENFVTGFHVAEVYVGKDIREQGKKAIAHHVPEIDHAMRPTTHEARSEDDVGFSVLDWAQQVRVVPRVVLQVCVLDQDDVPGRVAETSFPRRRLCRD